jgi:hypothetical protein
VTLRSDQQGDMCPNNIIVLSSLYSKNNRYLYLL